VEEEETMIRRSFFRMLLALPVVGPKLAAREAASEVVRMEAEALLEAKAMQQAYLAFTKYSDKP
jgi:hypothetical protein